MNLDNKRSGRRWRVGLGVAAIVLAALLLPRFLVDVYADRQRERLTGDIWEAGSEQETIERFARWAADYWHLSDDKDVWNRLRGLPKPFKPQKDPISFLSADGQCTEFVAAARYVLGERFKVVRHDILSPNAGHSAISIQLSDGRWVYLDPFYGWAFKSGGRLLGLDEVRARLAAGEALDTLAVRLKPDANEKFYQALPESFEAKEFEALDVRLRLPLEDRDRWSAGELDGEWRDVQRDGQASRLTSHFFYVGRRYPTKIRFHYELPENQRAYRLAFHLTEEPTPAELPDFSVAPSIQGKTLVFELAPDQRTLSVDTRDASRRNWFAIDRFEAIADPS